MTPNLKGSIVCTNMVAMLAKLIVCGQLLKDPINLMQIVVTFFPSSLLFGKSGNSLQIFPGGGLDSEVCH